MLKIRSVTIAPPMRAPKSYPMNVMTGMSELRKVCTLTMRPGDMPLAFAVRT